jgi:hypothetical protein
MQSANKRSTTGTPRNANTGDVFGVYVNVPQSLEMAY